jgi:hypothetical protein
MSMNVGKDSLERFVEKTRQSWGPLCSELVADCRRYSEELVMAPAAEAWLAALHRDAPAYQELYRDPSHGFVLLAHAEYADLYRPPHDHGRSWVIYAVQQGEIEMATYVRIQDADGKVRLVKRDYTLVRAGQVKVFLPGDIHDTRCMRGPALLFRSGPTRRRRERARITRAA